MVLLKLFLIWNVNGHLFSIQVEKSAMYNHVTGPFNLFLHFLIGLSLGYLLYYNNIIVYIIYIQYYREVSIRYMLSGLII